MVKITESNDQKEKFKQIEICSLVLEVLIRNLERVNKLDRNEKSSPKIDFLIRAIAMLGFYALNLSDHEDIGQIKQLHETFSTENDKDTFLTTILRLALKENVLEGAN